MKTKRLWVLTLAALLICGSASAQGFRRGGACKKCKMEQRFVRGKQFRGKDGVRFRAVRFQDPRFGDPRFQDMRFKDPRFFKKHGPKRHHRR